MKYIKKIGSVLILTLILFVSTPLVGFAKPSYTISFPYTENTLDPNYEFHAKPGEVLTHGLVIKNTSTEGEVLNFNAEVSKAPLKPTSTSLQIPLNWIEIDSSEFLIQPNESKTVDFKITIPKDTIPGKYISLIKAILNSYIINDQGVSFKVAIAKYIIVYVEEPDPIIPEPVQVPTELYAQLRCLKYYNGSQAPVKCDYDLIKSYNIDPIGRPFRICLNNHPNMNGLEVCLPEDWKKLQ